MRRSIFSFAIMLLAALTGTFGTKNDTDNTKSVTFYNRFNSVGCDVTQNNIIAQHTENTSRLAGYFSKIAANPLKSLLTNPSLSGILFAASLLLVEADSRKAFSRILGKFSRDPPVTTFSCIDNSRCDAGPGDYCPTSISTISSLGPLDQVKTIWEWFNDYTRQIIEEVNLLGLEIEALQLEAKKLEKELLQAYGFEVKKIVKEAH